jgi:putative phosphoesterase
MKTRTRIGLITDVHATPGPLQEALSVFHRAGVDAVFCAGDIAGYGDQLDSTVDLLIAAECQAIYGNHDLWFLEDSVDKDESRTSRYLANLPAVLEREIEGKKLYMVHASPPRDYTDGIKLLDVRGDVLPDNRQAWSQRLQGFEHDVLVVGHTHQIFAERLCNTLVVNPGSTKFNHSCAILSFPELSFEVFSLSGQAAVKTWNWGSNQVRSP